MTVRMSQEELRWIAHAASLRQMSAHEYIRRAINEALVRQGVDAVLLVEELDTASVPKEP